ncbi:MAG: arylesterase [Gemmatimonadetes bacterium]|nr:arylesterase [Gemmatimonadota bacterium]
MPGSPRSERPAARGSSDGTHGADPRASDLSSRSRGAAPTILFLGTSLTAGLGVDLAEAYPALIQRRLDSLGLGWRVVNGGLSGETSAGALRRLDWLLQGPIRVLVIETGANDGLRGQGLDSTRANLDAIVARARAYDSTMTIVLAGMEVPPNLGPRYATRFRQLFSDLARRERLALIPFLLEGVGGVDSLNQADGIHPNSAGHRIVAENVWRVIRPLTGSTNN